MIKGKIVRLFPNKEQEQLLWRHIGASRFIYNHMLALQIERHKKGEKHLSAFGMSYLLPEMKKTEDFTWLNDISARALQRSCADLATAYERFFINKVVFLNSKVVKSPKQFSPWIIILVRFGSLLPSSKSPKLAKCPIARKKTFLWDGNKNSTTLAFPTPPTINGYLLLV